MNEVREKIRCRGCELVQWNNRAHCRRCGSALPEPVDMTVERVVEKVVVRQSRQCLASLEEARKLILAATDRLAQLRTEVVAPIALDQLSDGGEFPTMAEVERAMIAAAYQKSNQATGSGPPARHRQDGAVSQAQRDG